MSYHDPDLYRWKRKTDRKPYTSSVKRVLPNANDIERWIQKVEEVTNQAAAEAFGLPHSSNKRNAKYEVLGTVEQLHEHEDTYAEAQELLQQWMSEKVDIDEEMNDYLDPQWEAKEDTTSPVVIRNDLFKWDAQHEKTKKNTDVYAYDYEKDDEGDIVNNILQNMMDKDVIHKEKIRDLRRVDVREENPRLRMEMRHQKVKENREKREKELERQRLERQRQKEVQLKAKQIVMKEDRDKQLKKKQEEELIQQEMARIRREMAEERVRIDRERKKQESMENVRPNVLSQNQDNLLTQRSDVLSMNSSPRTAWGPPSDRSEHTATFSDTSLPTKEIQREERKRRNLLKAMEVVQTKEAAHRLQILQRHFSAWYDLVLEKRVKMGKAQAILDWRCLLRAWNAWKAYTRSRRLQREDIEHQVQVKYMHRLNQMAEDHVRLKLLNQYFQSWRAWVQRQQTHVEIMEETSKTRNKMSDFLEAAASGRLWTSHSNTGGEGSMHSARKETASARTKVDELFAQPSKKLSSASSRTNNASSKQLRKPTEPWQVTKKHVKLSKEQIAHPSMKNVAGGDAPPVDAFDVAIGNEEEETEDKKPWEKTPFVPNTFEHRQKAQQKILSEQQKKIREQQRMIEDLIFNQQQQVLKQQAEQQQLLQKHIDNMPVTAVPPHSSQSKISKDKPSTAGNLSARSTASSARSDPSAVNTARSSVSQQSTVSKDSKQSTFVKGMEERAAERARMKAEREARRRQADEEKLAKLKAEEEERARLEAEQKKAKLEEYREKKRREKEKEEEKQRAIQKMQELAQAASSHYQKSLLVNYGWRPWRKLVNEMRGNTQRATQHANDCLLRKVVLAWHSTVRDIVSEKEQLADEMYNYMLVNRYLNNWKKCGELRSIQEQKADKFFYSRLKVKIFNAWLDYITQAKFDAWENERRARQHDIRRVVKKYFKEWRKYPVMLKAERARELRLAEMRRKVSSILPDFNS